MARRIFVLLSSAIAGALLACGGSVEQAEAGDGTNVNAGVELEGVVQIYSGRPAPTWTLRADEVRQIRERIQGLSSTAAPENFPNLGELALDVVNDHRARTLPDRIRVGRGVVEITTGSTKSHFADEKGLGELLEQSARAAGALPF